MQTRAMNPEGPWTSTETPHILGATHCNHQLSKQLGGARPSGQVMTPQCANLSLMRMPFPPEPGVVVANLTSVQSLSFQRTEPVDCAVRQPVAQPGHKPAESFSDRYARRK